ncbi:MAG: hypothetical protein MZV70_51410 [Desulfobacterales bacterium]|nr:hypothetical protein [Desulfobacterales bacterium]
MLIPAVGMAAGPPKDEVIATLDGKPITLSEIEENAAFQIYRLRGSIYSLLQRRPSRSPTGACSRRKRPARD